jgi:uncharacterized FlaG/YvyC family protein
VVPPSSRKGATLLGNAMVVDTKNGIADLDIVITSLQKAKVPKKMVSPGDVAAESMKINEETLRKIEQMVKESEGPDQMSMYYDRDIDRIVVTISDGGTQQIVRQIPAAESISFMKSFSQMTGLMINRRL